MSERFEVCSRSSESHRQRRRQEEKTSPTRRGARLGHKRLTRSIFQFPANSVYVVIFGTGFRLARRTHSSRVFSDYLFLVHNHSVLLHTTMPVRAFASSISVSTDTVHSVNLALVLLPLLVLHPPLLLHKLAVLQLLPPRLIPVILMHLLQHPLQQQLLLPNLSSLASSHKWLRLLVP